MGKVTILPEIENVKILISCLFWAYINAYFAHKRKIISPSDFPAEIINQWQLADNNDDDEKNLSGRRRGRAN